MFREYILCVLLLGFSFSGTCQIGAVIGKSDIHKGTRSSPSKSAISTKKPDFSTKKLAFSITRNANTSSEKVLNIYNWITQNIAYDNELMRSEKLQKQIYISEENVVRNVLDRKLALCGGFALLFERLCADVGIAAKAVNGFTKDYSGTPQKRKKPNHTWNVVKLNGEWKLLDITWAIGHGISGKPDNFWYLTNPKEFIYSHYPEDSKWTLMQNPISFSEFQKTLNR